MPASNGEIDGRTQKVRILGHHVATKPHRSPLSRHHDLLTELTGLMFGYFGRRTKAVAPVVQSLCAVMTIALIPMFNTSSLMLEHFHSE